MRTELPSGTVTFLFTDIEGSTRLLHALGPDAYAEALAEHRRVLRAAFAAHDGVEVDTQGDAFFVAFPTAPGAVAAARERAERARARADPRPDGTPHRDADRHRRGIRRRRRPPRSPCGGARARQTGAPHRGDRDAARHGRSDAHRPRSASAEGLRRAGARPSARHGAPPAARGRPGTVILPTPATRFLGRERELYDADLASCSTDDPGDPDHRRARRHRQDPLLDRARPPARGGRRRRHGLRPARRAPRSDARASGDRGRPRRGRRVAGGDRRTDRRATHAPACSTTSSSSFPSVARAAGRRSLRAAPTPRSSSRAARRSTSPARLGSTSLRSCSRRAVDASSSSVRSASRRDRADAGRDELCERLDRLPLALELAAARTSLLQPQSDPRATRGAARPAQRSRDADPRHATLRATIAWSHDLLAPDEQELFAELGRSSAAAARSKPPRRSAMPTSTHSRR